MTELQMYNLLTMLKTDLGITATAYDGRLENYIQSADTQIKREGIALDYESIDDSQLAVMYAAWMWRKRDGVDSGMPRMLRYQLNNRLFAEKVGGNG